MKIYFGFTVAGDRSAVEVARRIVDILVEMRHEVLTRHLVEDNAWEADRRVTPKEVYLRDMKWLDECDLFMAEVSGSSFGLGFETGVPSGGNHKESDLILSARCRSQNISPNHGHRSPELQAGTVFEP